MMSKEIYFLEMDSPVGPLTIVGTAEDGLCDVEFGNIADVSDDLVKWLKKHFGNVTLIESKDLLLPYVQAFEKYFSGSGTGAFDHLKIDLHGTPFQKKVWTELLKIEYGTTKTYKEVAEAIGSPKAVRAVGTAIGQNPLPIIIPCHRVINTNGKLGGFTGGLDKKIKLLEIENICIS